MFKKAVFLLAIIALATARFESMPRVQKLVDYFFNDFQSEVTEQVEKYIPEIFAPPHFDLEYLVGGWGGDLTEFMLNGTSRVVGKTVEYENTSWIAPTKEGFLISNQGADLISYLSMRGASKIHTLKNLTRPVMIGETSKGTWYAACHGDHMTKTGSGIAVGVASMNWTVFEHQVPTKFKPDSPSSGKPLYGQNYSKIEAVNEHAFMDDHLLILDAGWDNLYHYGINEWKEGLQIAHSFDRGFGPHNMAPAGKRGFLYVMGEYEPSFQVLEWLNETKEFKEVDKVEIVKPGMNWTGSDILVDMDDHIFVSLRHGFNQSGYIVKYEHTHNPRWGHGFRELAKSEVGAFPTRISLSEDHQRVIVANEFGDNVEILQAMDLKKIAAFKTPGMHPYYAHELRRRPHPHMTGVRLESE